MSYLTTKHLQLTSNKTTVFLLNEEEALMLTKKQDLDEAALVLLNMGPQFIIIKCGSKGSFLFEPNKPPFYVFRRMSL